VGAGPTLPVDPPWAVLPPCDEPADEVPVPFAPVPLPALFALSSLQAMGSVAPAPTVATSKKMCTALMIASTPGGAPRRNHCSYESVAGGRPSGSRKCAAGWLLSCCGLRSYDGLVRWRWIWGGCAALVALACGGEAVIDTQSEPPECGIFQPQSFPMCHGAIGIGSAGKVCSNRCLGDDGHAFESVCDEQVCRCFHDDELQCSCTPRTLGACDVVATCCPKPWQ
jgi:hypothetical protein